MKWAKEMIKKKKDRGRNCDWIGSKYKKLKMFLRIWINTTRNK